MPRARPRRVAVPRARLAPFPAPLPPSWRSGRPPCPSAALTPHSTLALQAPSPVELKPPPWQPPPSQPARCWRGSRARRWRRARRAVSQWEPAQRMWNLRANAATPRRQIKEDNILKKCPGGVVGASWLCCARMCWGTGFWGPCVVPGAASPPSAAAAAQPQPGCGRSNCI